MADQPPVRAAASPLADRARAAAPPASSPAPLADSRAAVAALVDGLLAAERDVAGAQSVLGRLRGLLEEAAGPVGRLLQSLDAAGRSAPPGGSVELFRLIEAERMRIARDMHDGPAQMLANLVLQAEYMGMLLRDGDPGKLAAELEDFKSGVGQALEETRRLIFDLRPMELDDLGLVTALRRLVEGLRERFQLDARLEIAGQERRITTAAEESVYRIVQEALTNVRRHARATRVVVALVFSPASLVVSIVDDGIGFDPDQPHRGHLGLVSLRERAGLLGADLRITSAAQQGTSVRFEVPC